MIGISELLSIGGTGYSIASGIMTGKKLDKILYSVNSNANRIEKLSNDILIRLDEAVIKNLNNNKLITELRDIKNYLSPLPELLNGAILSSAVSSNPKKMQTAFKKNVNLVLDRVKPFHSLDKHPNPEMIPILFYENNIPYVGWQMKGVLPLLFDVEFNPNSGFWQDNESQFFDINSYYLEKSIGIETMGGVYAILAERGQSLPYTHKDTFTTAADNQPSIEIHVLTGENKKVKENTTIGRFHMEGIPPSKKGIPQIDLSININEKGELTVSSKLQISSKITSQNFNNLSVKKIASNIEKIIISCRKCMSKLRIPAHKHIKIKCPKCNIEYEIKNSIIITHSNILQE